MKVETTVDGGEATMKIAMSEQEALKLIEDLSRTLQGGLTAAGTFKDDNVPYQQIRVLINRKEG